MVQKVDEMFQDTQIKFDFERPEKEDETTIYGVLIFERPEKERRDIGYRA